MPFDATSGVVYGKDAVDVPDWAARTLSGWLKARLVSQHSAALGITPARQPVVTHNSRTASAAYSRPSRPPVVFMRTGPVEASRKHSRIDGRQYRGARYEITLELDMGVSDDAEGDASETIKEDSALAAAVMTEIRSGLPALDALGIYNSEITADTERQRAGEGRHPHRLTFFCLSVDSYPAEWDEEG